MGKNLFKYLPSEIITNILSRLSLRTTAISKCVCKSWLDLLQNDEFVKLHLSRSAAALAVLMLETNLRVLTRCSVFEFEDEIGIESSFQSRHHITKVNFPHRVTTEGSVNGLLLLRKFGLNSDGIYVFNPISREYIELHYPEEFLIPRSGRAMYGFGMSGISGQYKVVRIIEFDCHVYTLGTGSWRRVETPRVSFNCGYGNSGAFVNEHLHWLESDLKGILCISCFDIETECFNMFSVPVPVPPLLDSLDTVMCMDLATLEDCLCLCDHTSVDVIAIWLMKEYGDEKSWRKEYVVDLLPDFVGSGYVFVCPIKVFKDGDVLMVWDKQLLFYYCKETKTTKTTTVFDGGDDKYVDSILLTPSFLSLKSFPKENVISL